MARRFTLALIFALGVTFLSSGCVKRIITIDSNPRGATVYFNGADKGITPVSFEFTSYGYMSVRVAKAGYRELYTVEKVKAPKYEYFPIDFISDNINPKQIRDERKFFYRLSKDEVAEEDKSLAEIKNEEDANFAKYVKNLKDKDRNIRALAAVKLTMLGRKEASPYLLEALKDTDPQVRINAANALRILTGNESLPVLIGLLNDKDAYIRRHAVNELEALRSKEAVPHLMRLLKDKDFHVRGSSVEALGAIGDKSCLPALVKLLKDKDSSVRASTAVALGKFADPYASAFLLKSINDKYIKVEVISALRKIKEKSAVPYFVKALRNFKIKVRNEAAKGIQELADKSVIELLKSRLYDNRWATRESTAKLMGELGFKEALPYLNKQLGRERNKNVKAALKSAIATLEKI
ncbi:MAG: HEAT repeat domain-containing protein [Candidatus Omnitrophota bacterium]